MYTIIIYACWSSDIQIENSGIKSFQNRTTKVVNIISCTYVLYNVFCRPYYIVLHTAAFCIHSICPLFFICPYFGLISGYAAPDYIYKKRSTRVHTPIQAKAHICCFCRYTCIFIFILLM